MLKLISDLNKCERVTREYGDIGVDATSGTWVTFDSNGKFVATGASATGLSFPIWDGGNRNGTPGFTPDVETTGKLTVLNGKFRIVTDQLDATYVAAGIAVGDPLVSKSGVLTKMSAGEEAAVVGHVSADLGQVIYLGTPFTDCIEFYSN
jgi:hypothetical protein